MVRFSRKFGTFEEWLNVRYARLVKDVPYFARIFKYLHRNPGATLSEARGHRPREKAIEAKPETIEEVARAKAKELKKLLSIWRTGLTMKNIVVHGEYYGCLLQAFADHPEDLPTRGHLENFMIGQLQNWLGYPGSEFWFWEIAFMGYEPPFEMYPDWEFHKAKWEFRVEKKGRIVYERKGSLREI